MSETIFAYFFTWGQWEAAYACLTCAYPAATVVPTPHLPQTNISLNLGLGLARSIFVVAGQKEGAGGASADPGGGGAVW